MQGNAAFPRQPMFSAGSTKEISRSMEQLPTQIGPDPLLYNVSAPQAAVSLSFAKCILVGSIYLSKLLVNVLLYFRTVYSY